MLLLTIALFLLFLTFPLPAWAQAIAEDVISFANKEGLTLTREGLSKEPKGYGYSNEAEISIITVGEGMQIHFIDGAKLRAASDSLIETVTPKRSGSFLFYRAECPNLK